MLSYSTVVFSDAFERFVGEFNEKMTTLSVRTLFSFVPSMNTLMSDSFDKSLKKVKVFKSYSELSAVRYDY